MMRRGAFALNATFVHNPTVNWFLPCRSPPRSHDALTLGTLGQGLNTTHALNIDGFNFTA
jgi:hypothetical protein